ncbi:MAG TPA: TIGR03084 family metal-binding protein [Acidimicrobiales bacterium]|nr:TIGR03084 family metal-binding protein [Acidimicrobiales bacterium]
MPSIAELCDDLRQEHESLDRVVGNLSPRQWDQPTPAAGWDVRDTISHLCFFDEAATLAIEDPPGFEKWRDELVGNMSGGSTPDVDIGRELGDNQLLLGRWRQSRERFVEIAGAAGAGPKPPRIAWFGPPMSLASFVTARIMETWAHGVDIRDGLDLALTPDADSSRLRHVCHLAYGARAFTFAAHGVPDPGDPVSFEVSAPDGSTWTWGPEDAVERITGTALEIALVFTQRRHPSRTSVRARGATAETWLSIAQAFAGPPTVTPEDR